MKIDNSVKITGMIIVGVLAVLLIVVNMFGGSTSNETISVEGISEISVMPDLVSVSFNVETLEDSAAEAKDENARIMNDVRAALLAAGIHSADLETRNFNVYEEFDWNGYRKNSLGFKATHSMIVSIDAEDEAMIGKIIDAALDNGALLGYINFELSRELENEYKAEAMKMAAEDARVKAESVADGLGVRLGKIVSTSVGSDFRYMPMMAYDAEENLAGSVKGIEIATNIEVGDQTVSSRISVRYQIK